LIAAVTILLLIGGAVLYYLRYIAPFETTDDAFIQCDVAYVSPRVSGPVVKLLITDNQHVKAGDVLFEIDPTDFATQLAQSRADLAAAKARLQQARAQIAVDQARIEQQQAAVAAAAATATRTKADAARYENVEVQAISRSQLDLAKTQATAADADVAAARSQVKAAEAQLAPDHAIVDASAAQVQQAEAKLQQAELDLSYTKVKAPIDGRITYRTVAQGNYVRVAQTVLAIVPDYVWVVANFKEIQLTHLKPGQPAVIHIDAYPNREFKGKVDSLQAGSGAAFSLLPPENAVGNYVKVVQRVPVKILFDEPLNESELDIAPGMSVEPKVRVQ
jgi:membrane fusion protein (multidrug efflux system)